MASPLLQMKTAFYERKGGQCVVATPGNLFWKLLNMKSRKLIQKISEGISFFDFHISHKQLLLRDSSLVGEKNRNLDILFEGVRFIQSVTEFEGKLEIYEGDENDEAYASSMMKEEAYWERGNKLFILKADQGEFFIVAGQVRIHENDFSVDKTSIVTPKW